MARQWPATDTGAWYTFSSSTVFWGMKSSFWFYFETGSHVAQAGLELLILYLPSAGITDRHLHTSLWKPLSEQERCGDRRALGSSVGRCETVTGKTEPHKKSLLSLHRQIPRHTTEGSGFYFPYEKKTGSFLKTLPEKNMFCLGSILI